MTKEPTKVLVCYLNSIIVIVAMFVYFLVKFKKKYEDERYGGHGSKKEEYDLHTLTNFELL